MLPETVGALLPFLAYAASLAGAGVLASTLFARLRGAFPLPSPAPGDLAGLAYRLLHAPAQARLAVFFLTAVISIGASVAVATLTGQPSNAAFDAALGVIISQLWHGAQLSTDLPEGE